MSNSKIKHTPGPWRVKQATGFDNQGKLFAYHWVGVGPIGDETPVLSRSLEENYKNAALISAAPEMLEALEAITLKLEGGGRDTWTIQDLLVEFNQARAAIAKAKGVV